MDAEPVGLTDFVRVGFAKFAHRFFVILCSSVSIEVLGLQRLVMRIMYIMLNVSQEV